MKTLFFLIVLICGIVPCGGQSVSHPSPAKEIQRMANRVIYDDHLSINPDSPVTATIYFRINEKRNLEIDDISSLDPALKQSLTRELSGRKLSHPQFIIQKPYRVKITFVAK